MGSCTIRSAICSAITCISSSESDFTSSTGIPDALRESREMEKMSNVLLHSSESICLLLCGRDRDGNTPGVFARKITHDHIDHDHPFSRRKNGNAFNDVLNV